MTYFDSRGTGVSDPIPYDVLSIDNGMDDGRAVMDAAGIERAALLGDVEGSGVRVWSLLYEYLWGAYALIGVVQLLTSAAEFASDYQDRILNGDPARDPEGYLYFLAEPQLNLLLEHGEGTARGLFDHKQILVRIGDLHGSSLYRLRLNAAVHGTG